MVQVDIPTHAIYTVVILGYPKGIKKGKKLRQKRILLLPSVLDGKCLQKANTLRFWLKVPAESKCQIPSDFCLRAYGIYLLQVVKIRIWGRLPSTGTFNQTLRVFTFFRYFPSHCQGNYSIFLRQSFFPLEFEGISYKSVVLLTRC